MSLVEFDALLQGKNLKFEESEDVSSAPKKSSSWIKSWFNAERKGHLGLFELVAFEQVRSPRIIKTRDRNVFQVLQLLVFILGGPN